MYLERILPSPFLPPILIFTNLSTTVTSSYYPYTFLCPTQNFDCSCFSGIYPTEEVTPEYLDLVEKGRGQDRDNNSTTTTTTAPTNGNMSNKSSHSGINGSFSSSMKSSSFDGNDNSSVFMATINLLREPSPSLLLSSGSSSSSMSQLMYTSMDIPLRQPTPIESGLVIEDTDMGGVSGRESTGEVEGETGN